MRIVRHRLAAFGASLALVWFSTPSSALTAQIGSVGAAGAVAFVGELGRSAVQELPALRLQPTQARAYFHQQLRSRFDLNGIAARVFAAHWKTAAADRRQRALALYEAWLTDGLMQLLGRHSGETFRVQRARKLKGAGWSVSSEVRRPNGERIAIEWVLRELKGGRFLITNLRTADGGDLIRTHREEFQMMLDLAPTSAQSQGLEYLIEELEIRTRS